MLKYFISHISHFSKGESEVYHQAAVQEVSKNHLRGSAAETHQWPIDVGVLQLNSCGTSLIWNFFEEKFWILIFLSKEL